MAVTSQRDTRERYNPESNIVEIQGADSTTFIKGALACRDNATGRLVMGTGGVATHVAVGRCEENFVTGAGNTRKIKVKTGTFKWANSGASPVVAANLGQHVFIEDNETVRRATATSSVAGVVFELDTDGVWVTTKHTNAIPAVVAT
jgi:hypothetical protein